MWWSHAFLKPEYSICDLSRKSIPYGIRSNGWTHAKQIDKKRLDKPFETDRIITADQAEAFFFNCGYLEAHIIELMLAAIFLLYSMRAQENVDSSWSLDWFRTKANFHFVSLNRPWMLENEYYGKRTLIY